MKRLVIFTTVLLCLCLAQNRRYNVQVFNRYPYNNNQYNLNTAGQYRPDNSGSYRRVDDGQYRPDNSGAYRADDGRYVPDDSGRYKPDGSGAYKGSADKYVHQDEKYKHQGDIFGGNGNDGSGIGGSGGSGGFGQDGNRYGSNLGTGNGNRYGSNLNAGGGNSGAGSGKNQQGSIYADGYGKPVELKKGSAAGLYDNRNYAIIRKVEQVENDGYHYLYETENKIFGEEQGKLANKGTKDEVMRANGYFEYTGPDSVVYHVDYTADENGFVPAAAHLPTPPPIPVAILRSLEWKKSIGEL